MIRFCKSHLPREVLNDAFQFSCERMKKYLGAWHVDTYPMFPGYVVLESCCPELLSEELERRCGRAGIIEKAPVAQKALPYCSITCITGREMKEALSGYLSVLFGQDPQSVGGAMPGDDFYFE